MMLGALAAIVVVANGGLVQPSKRELTAPLPAKPSTLAIRPPTFEQDALLFDW